jgi:hypothetical protein
MAEFTKARSPFSPGQPAGVDVFVGRSTQIARLVDRGAGQTAQGKPTAFFVEGEYGIGKSSLANYCLQAAERRYGLLGVTASLAGLVELPAVAQAVLKAV